MMYLIDGSADQAFKNCFEDFKYTMSRDVLKLQPFNSELPDSHINAYGKDREVPLTSQKPSDEHDDAANLLSMEKEIDALFETESDQNLRYMEEELDAFFGNGTNGPVLTSMQNELDAFYATEDNDIGLESADEALLDEMIDSLFETEQVDDSQYSKSAVAETALELELQEDISECDSDDSWPDDWSIAS